MLGDVNCSKCPVFVDGDVQDMLEIDNAETEPLQVFPQVGVVLLAVTAASFVLL
jgi:hypothetical protein